MEDTKPEVKPVNTQYTSLRNDLVTSAEADLKRGVWSVVLKPNMKRPKTPGWLTARLSGDELRKAFEDGDNRGRLLGVPPAQETPGGFLVVVDLDTPDAIAMGQQLLPPTGEIGGRRSAPTSHLFYRCNPLPRTVRFTGPDKTRYLELLSTGSQVVVPPSMHPSGEPYVWTQCAPARDVARSDLLMACADVAIAILLARGVPNEEWNEVIAAAGGLLNEDRRKRVLDAVRSIDMTGGSIVPTPESASLIGRWARLR